MKGAHWTEDVRLLPALVDELDSDAESRRRLDMALLRLYYGRPLTLTTSDPTRASSRLADVDAVRGGGFSLYRQIVDAASSLIVRIPAIRVLPVGENWTTQKSSKGLGRFVNGVFYANDIDRKADRVFTAGANTRFGALKFAIDPRTKEIRAHHVDSLNLLWDEGEGVDPRNLFEQKAVPRRFLAKKYPEHAYEIEKAPHWEEKHIPGVDPQSFRDRDTVRVIEAWALPIGKEPGRHVIRCGDAILEDEEYEHERVPFAIFRWKDSNKSFGGVPVGEALLPYQVWTNRLVRMIEEAQRGAVPKFIAHESAEVQAPSDKIFEKITYRGNVAPRWETPQAITAEIYNWRATIKAEAYEEAGVNMSLAQGKTEPGIVSAVAQRERVDIGSTRLIRQTKRFELFFKDCAEVVIMLARATYDKKGFRVRSPGTRMLEEIDWAEINLKEDQYSLQVQSTSALPLTIAGRLEFVKELMAEGMISQKDGLRLLQIPDTESIADRQAAPLDLAEKQVEAALWDGKYIPPEPIQDLQLLLDVATGEILRALQNPTWPAENIELCRRLIAEAKVLQGQQAPAPAPAAPPPAPEQGGETSAQQAA